MRASHGSGTQDTQMEKVGGDKNEKAAVQIRVQVFSLLSSPV